MVARGRRRAIGPGRGPGRLEEAGRWDNGQRLWDSRHCSRCSQRFTSGPPRRRRPSRGSVGGRSEERRVGKEGRARGSTPETKGETTSAAQTEIETTTTEPTPDAPKTTPAPELI